MSQQAVSGGSRDGSESRQAVSGGSRDGSESQQAVSGGNINGESNYDNPYHRHYNRADFYLEEARRIAKSQGGECTSNEYTGSRDNLGFKCKEGHEWETRLCNIRNGRWCKKCDKAAGKTMESKLYVIVTSKRGTVVSIYSVENRGDKRVVIKCEKGHIWDTRIDSIVVTGTWCRICSNNARKRTIEDAHDLARMNNGTCLSTSMEDGAYSYLRWRCAVGHEWVTMFRAVYDGRWCYVCFRETTRNTLEMANEIATQNGGRCLSSYYTNIKLKLLWICAENHVWAATLDGVKNSGYWCPKCVGRAKITIEEAKELAISKNGLCLSDTIQNSRIPISWKCNVCSHEWAAAYANVKQNTSWCPKCAQCIKYTVEQMKDLAKGRGGEYLSDVYINVHAKTPWKCKEGHVWSAKSYQIIQGSWCPVCIESQGERCVREFLESASIEYVFQQTWSDCKNIKPLPFDFFLPEFNLAIEYDGEQYFNSIEFYGGDQGLEERKTRDAIKNNYCMSKGISLIRIGYWEFDMIPDIICEALKVELGETFSTFRLFDVSKKKSAGLNMFQYSPLYRMQVLSSR